MRDNLSDKDGSATRPSLTRGARLFIFFAGVFGLAGIGLAAGAAHLSDTRLLGGASAMCLAHAPALLALGLNLARLRTGFASGLLMLVGTALFSGDLIARHSLGSGLFPMSAPIGGVLMMFGWVGIGLGAFLPLKDA